MGHNAVADDAKTIAQDSTTTLTIKGPSTGNGETGKNCSGMCQAKAPIRHIRIAARNDRDVWSVDATSNDSIGEDHRRGHDVDAICDDYGIAVRGC